MIEPDRLKDLENDFPGWHCWKGVGGDTFYARRTRSSPPVVFRAQTIAGLREQIKDHRARQGQGGE